MSDEAGVFSDAYTLGLMGKAPKEPRKGKKPGRKKKPLSATKKHVDTEDMPPLAPMCKVSHFSEATGIPNRTLRRALNRGELPGVRIGRAWYINTAKALKALGISE